MLGETLIPGVLALLLQAYEFPPLAVSVALAPLQIVTVAGVMPAVGLVFTFTMRDAEPVQVFASVTVTL